MDKPKYPKITIVIGTKAELIKCMPIMLELQKQKKDYWFIHTGQHPLGKACEDFGVKRPDFILSKEPNRSTKFWSKVNKNSFSWFLSMIFKIRRLIRKIKPRYVIYHGDTMSSVVAAIASSTVMSTVVLIIAVPPAANEVIVVANPEILSGISAIIIPS